MKTEQGKLWGIILSRYFDKYLALNNNSVLNPEQVIYKSKHGFQRASLKSSLTVYSIGKSQDNIEVS